MNITFSRKDGRTRLICRRADGTFTSADLGPSLPGHDFAHLIVERTQRLPAGFFVNIAKGDSIPQLSDAATIRSLGADPYVAEILARALGSLATGACTAEQFPELVGTELRQIGLSVPGGVRHCFGRFLAVRQGTLGFALTMAYAVGGEDSLTCRPGSCRPQSSSSSAPLRCWSAEIAPRSAAAATDRTSGRIG